MDRIVLSIVLALLLWPNSSVVAGSPLVPYGMEGEAVRIMSLDNNNNNNNNGMPDTNGRQRRADNSNATNDERYAEMGNRVRDVRSVNNNNNNNLWAERMLTERPNYSNVRELGNRLAIFDLFDSLNSFFDPLRSERIRQGGLSSSSSLWPMFKRQLIRPKYSKKHRDILRGLALKRSDQSADIEHDSN